MKTIVDLTDDRPYQLRRVILLYGAPSAYGGFSGSLSSAYAVSAPAAVDGTGVVEVGSYEPVTMEFVQELARGLGVDLPREVLPPHVLCRTQDVIAWWTRPRQRTLFFSDHCKLADLSGEEFPVPALVWRLDLKDNRLFLRALAGTRRPGGGTPLFVAPFLNVYNDSGFGHGLVCQGTMRRPARAGVANLEEWEAGFFDAAGGSQLAAAATKHRGQLFGLWRSLRGKKTFPAGQLVDAGQTLAQFIGAK